MTDKPKRVGRPTNAPPKGERLPLAHRDTAADCYQQYRLFRFDRTAGRHTNPGLFIFRQTR